MTENTLLTEGTNSCTANPVHSISDNDDSRLSKPPSSTTSATELARSKISLRAAMRSYLDFPIPGVNFLDFMPLFASPDLHSTLIRALELQVLTFTNNISPNIIVALDARGFLFGPSLALRLDAGFVPVRKRNKLPGPTVTASYEKEYGTDHFEMQADAITKGQSVLIVDDIIATGKNPILIVLSIFSGRALHLNVRRFCSSGGKPS